MRQQLASGKVPTSSPKPPVVWPRSPAAQQRVDLSRLRREILANESLVGKFVTADGAYQAMIVTLDPEIEYSTAMQAELRQQMLETLDHHGLGCDGQHLIGLPVMNLAIVHEMDSAVKVMLPICVFLLGLTIYLVFGQVRVVLISIGLGLIAVVWALGATAWLYGELTILVAAAPVVVLAVSTADFIHLTSAYQQRLRQGREHRAAIIDVFSEVGGACILTSVTTFVGFGALVLVESPTVRHFGFAIAFGSAIALLLILGLLPFLFFKLHPVSANTTLRFARWCDGGIDRVTSFCNRISARHPAIVFAACALPCIPSLLAVAARPIEADVPSRFPADHPWNESLTLADTKLSGSHFLEFYISGPSDRLYDPEVIQNLKEALDGASGVEEIRNITSVVTLYDAIDEGIGYKTKSGLPPSATSARASVRWMRAMLPGFTRAVTNNEGTELHVRVMVTSMGFRAIHRLAEHLESRIAAHVPDGVSVKWGGTYPLVGSIVTDIIYSQIRGFGFCILSLTVIMIWGLRSFRMGVVSQIPNLIPVILMLGVVAATRRQIDSDMLGLPMIALGLAVDDTIHFLHRFQHARAQSESIPEAVDHVFASAGRSIVVSTVALCVGLIPLAFSSFLSLWMLGTYLVAGLAGAVIADLLCLPAMIHLGWLGREQK